MHIRMLIAGLLAALLASSSARSAPPSSPGQSGNGQHISGDQLGTRQIAGSVVNAPGSDRMMTIKVDNSSVQVNQQALAGINRQLQGQIQHIRRLEQQIQQHIARRQNPANLMQQLQQAMVRLQLSEARGAQGALKVIPGSAEVEVQVAEDAKIRTLSLPEVFDDKGNIKKYTPAELKELKGKDTSLPGYESSLEQVLPGTVVKLWLAPHKAARPTTASKADATSAGAPAEAKLEQDPAPAPTATDHKIQVKMIVIIPSTGNQGSQGRKR